MTREEFLELENPAFSYHGISEVEYFYGPNVIGNIHQKDILKNKEEMDAYTRGFVSQKVFEVALSLAPNTKITDIAYNLANSYSDIHHANREQENKIATKRPEQTASDFYLELQINTRSVENSMEDSEIYLLPTEDTYNLFDRWAAVNIIDSDYPYPVLEIQHMDWNGLNDFLYTDKNKSKMINSELDRSIFEYIFKGTESPRCTKGYKSY